MTALTSEGSLNLVNQPRALCPDAEVMFYAQEIPEGAPTPVSLTPLRPDIELDVRVASQPERNLPLLEGALKRVERSADDQRWRAILSQGAAIVRSVRTTREHHDRRLLGSGLRLDRPDCIVVLVVDATAGRLAHRTLRRDH